MPGYASQRDTHKIPEPYPILTKQKKKAGNDLFIMDGWNVLFLGGLLGEGKRLTSVSICCILENRLDDFAEVLSIFTRVPIFWAEYHEFKLPSN